MPRAQCIVIRGNRILMAKHGMDGLERWCLPGGGIEPGETPEDAALRELEEECHVTGRIVRKTNVSADLESDTSAFSFHVDIGEEEPVLGADPDLPEGRERVLRDIRWLTLSEIPERDRTFLWSAGLLAVPGFWHEVEQWGGALSYPTCENRLTGMPDIDATLRVLERRVRGILHENLAGLYLYGSLATGGFDPESSDIDFVAATFREPLLNGFWRNCLDGPTFLRSRRYQSFAVLTMCRALRALEHGDYVSKRDAASWTMNAVESKWVPLIVRALRWQTDPNLDEAGLVETLEFIRYTIQRSQNPKCPKGC